MLHTACSRNSAYRAPMLHSACSYALTLMLRTFSMLSSIIMLDMFHHHAKMTCSRNPAQLLFTAHKLKASRSTQA